MFCMIYTTQAFKEDLRSTLRKFLSKVVGFMQGGTFYKIFK